MFYKVTLSTTMKSDSGLSYSKISIGYPNLDIYFLFNFVFSVRIVPSGYTYPGKRTLQSSHSNAFQQ